MANQCEKDMSEVNRMKRNLTLDLGSGASAKRCKFASTVIGAPVLSSPDVKKFNLTSPEIERFIQQTGPVLPTPSTPHTRILFPKSIPEEDDDDFSKDYNGSASDDSNAGGPPTIALPKSSADSASSGTRYYNDNSDNRYPTSLPTNFSIVSPKRETYVKEETSSIPSIDSSPPVSPINMESQERIKLERKRMRNRVAASKCRKRKLERISKLEEKVRQLKGENNELTGMAIRLKDDVCKLKEKVMSHAHRGCRIMSRKFFESSEY